MCKEPNYKIWYVSRACRKYLYPQTKKPWNVNYEMV